MVLYQLSQQLLSLHIVVKDQKSGVPQLLTEYQKNSRFWWGKRLHVQLKKSEKKLKYTDFSSFKILSCGL